MELCLDYEPFLFFSLEGLKGKDVPLCSDSHIAVPWKHGQLYQVFLSLWQAIISPVFLWNCLKQSSSFLMLNDSPQGPAAPFLSTGLVGVSKF